MGPAIAGEGGLREVQARRVDRGDAVRRAGDAAASVAPDVSALGTERARHYPRARETPSVMGFGGEELFLYRSAYLCYPM